MNITRKRLPEWLKRGIPDTDKTKFVRKILKDKSLNTVCESARCPNRNECYSCNTATFLILGDTCTRNCRFCSVKSGKPQLLDGKEPQNIALAAKEMNLEYVVITSVTRDDLPDGGAGHFAKTIKAIKNLDNNIKVEVLTPDFLGKEELIDIIIEAKPDVINHNIETIERLYKSIRPQADYARSLAFLKYVKDKSNIRTKTSLMVGFGESKEEVTKALADIKSVNCDIVTIGQYIQPTLNHVKVERYLEPDEYKELEQIAKSMGIEKTVFGPLVRSSYKAEEVF